ncbi:MAG: hypothetical protein BGO57_00030 [Sphingomonadales bacterium 63-6]|nr:MAG: hypothetical protein BGO57_00030 [Sphingomonadales bacterium 63-6]
MATKPILTAIALTLAMGQVPSPAHAQDEAPLALALDRTESIRQVRDLQTLLAQYIETGDWDAASGLFSTQATVELGVPTAAGRKGIRAALIGHFGAGSDVKKGLRASLLMAPVLTLSPDGLSAKGRWHEVGMFGGSSVSDNWTGGIYENTYVREDGAWRIAHLGYHAQFAGDYAQGWKNLVPDLPVIPYHYQAETVGTPAYASAAPSTPVPSISAPMIAARAQRLDDEDQVRNLQYIYGYYRDRRMWPDVTDLFAQDSSFSSAEIGTYRGAEGIRAALEREGPEGLRHGDINDYPIMNLIVCVAPDGKTARARGYDFGMTGNNDAGAFWSFTLFDNLFEKSDGVWRFKQVRNYPRMRTDHRVSWDEAIQHLPAPARKADGPAPAEPTAMADCAAPQPSPVPLDAARARSQIHAAAATIAIDNASNAFGNYIDDFEWEALGKVFTQDGLREAPGVGFYRGPARIEKMEIDRYGRRASPRTFIPIHGRIQPVIHLSADGQSAKLRTRLLQFNSSLSGGSMMGGMYEDEARLEDGVWRLSFVEIDHYLQTRNYKDAWTNIPEGLGHRMIPRADGLLKDFPPDWPLVGEIYAPYPTIGLMWFHYANPVSGRRPDFMTPKATAVMSRTEEPLQP